MALHALHIDPDDWPRSEGVLVDKLVDGAWQNIGYYFLCRRKIELDLKPGDRIRAAGFRKGRIPLGAPAGVSCFIVGDYVTYDA